MCLFLCLVSSTDQTLFVLLMTLLHSSAVNENTCQLSAYAGQSLTNYTYQYICIFYFIVTLREHFLGCPRLLILIQFRMLNLKADKALNFKYVRVSFVYQNKLLFIGAK